MIMFRFFYDLLLIDHDRISLLDQICVIIIVIITIDMNLIEIEP
jgi:hypothetical protein